MGEDSGEKTEDPTPHKLREAREKGQIAKSKEITGAALLFVSFYVLKAIAPSLWDQLSGITQYCWGQIGTPFSIDMVISILNETLYFILLVMAPLLVSTFLVALVLEAVQNGFLISFDPLSPDLNKLNPIEGLKKLFSMKQIVELIKSIIKMIIIVLILYYATKDEYIIILQSQSMTLNALIAFTGGLIMKVVTRVGMFYVVIALLDYFYQRYEYIKGLKMTKKEVKDEYKRLEGDPLIKQRQRDAQRAMSQGRQMGAVPGADVVVTNPTHYAIAIEYKPNSMQAPVVVAKGERLFAREIIKVAESHYIPIIENPPLARSLYKLTPVGAEIPPDYYQAVAEILAFVYNLKKKRSRRY